MSKEKYIVIKNWKSGEKNNLLFFVKTSNPDSHLFANQFSEATIYDNCEDILRDIGENNIHIELINGECKCVYYYDFQKMISVNFKPYCNYILKINDEQILQYNEYCQNLKLIKDIVE